MTSQETASRPQLSERARNLLDLSLPDGLSAEKLCSAFYQEATRRKGEGESLQDRWVPPIEELEAVAYERLNGADPDARAKQARELAQNTYDAEKNRAREKIAKLHDGVDADALVLPAPIDIEHYAKNGIPPVQWRLPGWIMKKDIAILAGDGGQGKSTTLVSLAYALATNSSWCGISPERAYRVLYIDEEQDEEALAALFLRIAKGHKDPIQIPETLTMRAREGFEIASPYGLARMEQAIYDHQAEMVFFDSLSHAFGDVDMNSPSACTPVYKGLFALQDRCGAEFVFTGHLRKPDESFRIKTRTMYSVAGAHTHVTQSTTTWIATPGPGKSLDIVQKKRRRANEMQSLRIAYSSEGDNAPITLTGEGPVEIGETEKEKCCDFILEYLGARIDQPIKKAELEKQGMAAGFAKSTIGTCLTLLYGKGKGPVGKPKRGWYSLKRENREKPE